MARGRVRRRSRLLSWYVAAPLLLAVVLVCGIMWYDLDEDRKDDLLQWRFFPASGEEDELEDILVEKQEEGEILEDEEGGKTKSNSYDTKKYYKYDEDKEKEILSFLKEKYDSIPDFFSLHEATSDTKNDLPDHDSVAPPSSGKSLPNTDGGEFTTNQFLHLHHMKTGGTSMDQKLRCTMDRLKKDGHYKVAYFNIHECSEKRFENCLSGHDTKCLTSAKSASIMSYCAALKHLPTFGWNEPPKMGSITVLRHPVDRVWSMYRFQTKGCYKCRPLLDIYNDIDAGKTDQYKDMCLQQLMNHEVANLLSSEEAANTKSTDEAQVKEAIDNLNWFTIVGLTEQLPTTIEMVGQVFPWMADDVDWSDKSCPLEHKNGSPTNNHCGPDGKSHMELPDHPDAETRKAIEAHNQKDVALYEAALRHFELQKQALGIE